MPGLTPPEGVKMASQHQDKANFSPGPFNVIVTEVPDAGRMNVIKYIWCEDPQKDLRTVTEKLFKLPAVAFAQVSETDANRMVTNLVILKCKARQEITKLPKADAEPKTAQDDAKGLQVVRALIIPDPDGKTASDLKVRLFVKNVEEKDVSVLTRNLQLSLSNYTDKPKELSINLSKQANIDGSLVIPSLFDLSPVTLKKGESAEIQLAYRDRKNLDKVVLVYDMRNDLAKRFNAWDGIIRSDVVEVMKAEWPHANPDTVRTREERALEHALSFVVQKAEEERAKMTATEGTLKRLRQEGADEAEISKITTEVNREKAIVAALEARIVEERQKVKTETLNRRP